MTPTLSKPDHNFCDIIVVDDDDDDDIDDDIDDDDDDDDVDNDWQLPSAGQTWGTSRLRSSLKAAVLLLQLRHLHGDKCQGEQMKTTTRTIEKNKNNKNYHNYDDEW